MTPSGESLFKGSSYAAARLGRPNDWRKGFRLLVPLFNEERIVIRYLGFRFLVPEVVFGDPSLKSLDNSKRPQEGSNRPQSIAIPAFRFLVPKGWFGDAPLDEVHASGGYPRFSVSSSKEGLW